MCSDEVWGFERLDQLKFLCEKLWGEIYITLNIFCHFMNISRLWNFSTRGDRFSRPRPPPHDMPLNMRDRREKYEYIFIAIALF